MWITYNHPKILAWWFRNLHAQNAIKEEDYARLKEKANYIQLITLNTLDPYSCTTRYFHQIYSGLDL